MSAPGFFTVEPSEVSTTDGQYVRWLAENFDRLDQACMNAPVDDKGAWLRQQYRLETGNAL